MKKILLSLLVFLSLQGSAQILFFPGAGVTTQVHAPVDGFSVGYQYDFFLGARLFERYDFGIEYAPRAFFTDANTSVSNLSFKGQVYFSPLTKMEAHLKPEYLYVLHYGAGLYTHKYSDPLGKFGQMRKDHFGFQIGAGIKRKAFIFALNCNFINQFYTPDDGMITLSLTASYSFEFFKALYQTITTRYDCQ